MKSRSTLLLQRALYLLDRDPISGIEVDLIDRNVHAWRVTLSGLDDSDWAVRPNDGVLVCALLQFWASGTDLAALLVAIQNLLSEPMVTDPCPANYAAASLYVKDPATYFNRVREMAYAAPIALQQLRFETQFAHATQVFLHTFAEQSQSRAPTRPASAAPNVQPVPAPVPPGPPKITVSHDTHVTLKRYQPCRPRVRKLLFENYYSDWQSLATTVPGNNCRVEFSSDANLTGAGKTQTHSTSTSSEVQMSHIPTGHQVASIVGARNKNQVLVNLKPGVTPQALAMHVSREDATAVICELSDSPWD
ncbi:hypothetical protein BCR44DRAFT_1482860 [Catenaria anguillulae PL171]|uniref:Uncharacterized protein n=1 Tax=Catenaria anguillulae PL171 TaxID=765915 RepID=A0A1Y2I0V3_9FUNG|nr:hypothetical protein BCR44DRAFT_1482860 [Catenaria anguillulae PL171]